VKARQLVSKAETSRRAGQLGRSRALFADAARAAEGEGDVDALVTAALGVGGLWVYEQRDFLEQAALDRLWRMALDATSPGSLAAARLDVRLAAEAVYQGGPVEAVQKAANAVTAHGDPGATAEALSLLHHVQLCPSYAHTRLNLAEDIVRHSTRAGDAVLDLMGLCWRTVDLFLLGDNRADQSLTELRARSEGAGCEAVAFVAAVMGAMRLARAGRLEAAEVASAEACERGVRAGDPDASAYFGAMIGALRWWQGRGGEVIDDIRALGTSPRLGTNDHVYVAADAVLSAALGDVDAAEEALTRLTGGDGPSALPCSSSWLTTLFLIAEAAFILGDARATGEIAALVAPFADLPVMPSLAVVCFGPAHRSLGLAASLDGDLDTAVQHLERSVTTNRRLGNRPMGVLTEHTLAGVLRARGADGDSSRAEALAARAASRAARIGMSLPPAPEWLAPRSGQPRRATLSPVAGGWRVTVEGRDTVVADRLGMGYLATLLEASGEEIHVLRLMAGTPQATQELLDDDAIHSYRSRAIELTRLLDSVDDDAARAAGVEAELASVNAALRASIGLGGRSRDFPTEQERARTSVRKALLRALAAVGAVEPELASYLERSLTTGFTCSYDPAGSWKVVVER